MTNADDTCVVCGQSLEWHQANNPQHAYVVPGTSGGLSQLGPSNRERRAQMFRSNDPKSHVKVVRGLPDDPALRIVLLRRGVITQDELIEAEREIREAQEKGTPIVVVAPSPNGPAGGDRPAVDVGHGGSSRRGMRFADPATHFRVPSVPHEERGGESA